MGPSASVITTLPQQRPVEPSATTVHNDDFASRTTGSLPLAAPTSRTSPRTSP